MNKYIYICVCVLAYISLFFSTSSTSFWLLQQENKNYDNGWI